MGRSLFNAPQQIAPASITRALLNTSLAGSSVIARVIAGTNITLTQTGADAGTGDVTINATPVTVTSQGTSYSETATSGEVLRKITASGLTITLPTAVGNTAKLNYKLMVAGSTTFVTAGSETIDGGTAALSGQYQTMTIVSDNANWMVI